MKQGPIHLAVAALLAKSRPMLVLMTKPELKLIVAVLMVIFAVVRSAAMVSEVV